MRHLFTRLNIVWLAVLIAAGASFIGSRAEASSLCLVPTGTTTCASAPMVATQGVDITLDLFASLDAGLSASAFVADLGFSSAALDYFNAVDGGFLGACASVNPCFNQTEFPGEVLLSYFDDTGVHAATGAGVLARLTFKPLLSGSTPISFVLAGLDDSSGLPLFVDDFGNPTLQGQGLTMDVRSATAPTPVPEPASLLLLGTGFAGAALRRVRSSGVTQ